MKWLGYAVGAGLAGTVAGGLAGYILGYLWGLLANPESNAGPLMGLLWTPPGVGVGLVVGISLAVVLGSKADRPGAA